MRIKQSWLIPALLASVLAINLTGCRDNDGEAVTDTTTQESTTPSFPEDAIMVEVGDNLGASITEAFINARAGDVIVLPEGNFKLDRTLLFDGNGGYC